MNLFKIVLILIILLSIFLRFYNYQNRWGLATDQAHDALVARYALETQQLPLLGPFSSAGPFQTGGQWYWLIMIGTLIYPFTVISPWIFMTLLSVLFVFLMYKIGTEFFGEGFGLFAGFLSAISTSQIAQSTNLTNQTPLAFFSALSLWASLKFTKTKNPLFLLFLGLFISTGATIHLQGAPLFFLGLITIGLNKYLKPKGILYFLIGLVLPLTPIIISDLNHNFYNFRNMAQYYLHDQYKISLDVLGRNWRTYLGIFWPNSWGYIIGGDKTFGFFFGFGTLYLLYKTVKTRDIPLSITLSTLLSIAVILRYTRTPLFDSYLIFSHPFVILVSALIVFEIVKKYLPVGLLIITVIALLTLKNDFRLFNVANAVDLRTNELVLSLNNSLPKEKFALYDYKLAAPIQSLPLSLYLDSRGRIKDNGLKIGIATSGATLNDKVLVETSSYKIYDLGAKSKKEISKERWFFVNPSSIYNSTEKWNK